MPTCCVITCKNSSSKTKGISFHSFPTESDLKEKWVLATGRSHKWLPTKNSRICSVHFQEVLKTRRLPNDAVPSLNLPELTMKDQSKHCNDTDDSLYICRACLRSEGELIHIFRNNLQGLLTNFMGTLVSLDDALPAYVCSYCLVRVKKSAMFRNRCQEATTFLKKLGSHSKLSIQNVCNLTNFRLNLTKTDVEILSCGCCQPEGYITTPINVPTKVSFAEISTNSELGTLIHITTKPKTIRHGHLNANKLVHVLEQSGFNCDETINKTAPIHIENKPNENELVGDDEQVLFEPETYVNQLNIEVQEDNLHNLEINESEVLASEIDNCKVFTEALSGKEFETQCTDISEHLNIDDDDINAFLNRADDNNIDMSLNRDDDDNIDMYLNIDDDDNIDMSLNIDDDDDIIDMYLNRDNDDDIDMSSVTNEKELEIQDIQLSENLNINDDDHIDISLKDDDHDIDMSLKDDYDDDIDMSPITTDGNNVDIDYGHKNSSNKNKSALEILSININTQPKRFKATCEFSSEIEKHKRLRIVLTDCMRASKTDKESMPNETQLCLDPYEKEYIEKLGFKSRRWVRLDEISKNYNVDIQILTKDEMKKEIEDRKTSNNYLNSDFKCDICYLGFMKKNSYNNHMLLHSSERGTIPCEVCGTMFKSRNEVNTHIKNHHAINYKCRNCHVVKKRLKKIKLHYDVHQGNRLTCKFCNKQFSTWAAYSYHTKRLHSDAQCPICHEKNVNEKGVARHIQLMHGSMKSCEPCGTTFQSELAYNTHLRLPDGQCGGSRPCYLCGKHFPTIDELASHMKECEKTPKLTLQCPKCLKYFKNPKKLRDHIENAHMLRLKTQNPGSGHVCDVCGKTGIRTLYHLRYHQYSHTGERPHKCNYCYKDFKTRQYLQVHRRIHCDIRPYQCHMCPKSFTQSAHLTTHIKHHTKETPYECEFCKKKFMHSKGVREHIRSMHMGIKRKRNRTAKKQESNEES